MKKSLKIYNHGTHRALAPSDTLNKVKKYYKDFGITRVANITGLDNLGIPVVLVSRPNSRSLSVSQGKGATYDAAAASAVMESIEGFHAERIYSPTRIMSYHDLAEYESVIDISRLSQLTSSKFHKEQKISWVQGHDLFSEKNTWLPFECVHTDYTEPWPEGHGNFICDSNGLASGNTLTEAINHALYEVIERDALALWSLTHLQEKKNQKVILSSIRDESLQKMITKMQEADIGIGIWDITCDTKMPTYVCKIIPKNVPKEMRTRPAYGSGTHISPIIALSRAITEAAQSRLTFISGARDDQYQSIYESQISDTVYQKWHDEIVDQKEFLNFNLNKYPENDYLEEDQDYILQSLKKVGISEAVYVDLTRPKYNIPVVKVIVPGLEGISFPGERLLGERGKNAYSKSGVGACARTH